MPLIFVDANVYLDSYRGGSKKPYRDLLRSLNALGDAVFVTKQVAYEVERNRVKVYVDNNKIEIKSSGLGQFQITPHYADDTSEVDELKERFTELGKTITKGVAKIEKEMEKLHQKNLLAIVEGTDGRLHSIAENVCKRRR